MFKRTIQPSAPQNDSGELTDEQLEGVSGGFWWLLGYAKAADATFGESMRTLGEAMGGNGVVAGPNGEGDKISPVLR